MKFSSRAEKDQIEKMNRQDKRMTEKINAILRSKNKEIPKDSTIMIGEDGKAQEGDSSSKQLQPDKGIEVTSEDEAEEEEEVSYPLNYSLY